MGILVRATPLGGTKITKVKWNWKKAGPLKLLLEVEPVIQSPHTPELIIILNPKLIIVGGRTE